MGSSSPPLGSSSPTLCSAIRDSANTARENREKRANTPQPWVVLKITILFAVLLIGYASYVVIGRTCIPFMKHSDSRAKGIGLLVGYAILLLMMLWCYVVVVLTPPGKAKDYAKPCPKPIASYVPPPPSQEFYASEPYSSQYPTNDTHPQNTHLPDPDVSRISHAASHEFQPTLRSQRSHQSQAQSHIHGPSASLISIRRPSTTPVLLPEYRYCSRDGFIKPYRAHHCRACGTCILKYDHHCPWIGQCVGARNHRFFILFNFWAALYTAFTLGLMISNLATRGTEDLDPQWILITALSGLFFVFTLSLYATHCRLVILNQTTVESLGHRDMKEREQHHSNSWRFWDRSQKRLSNEEWGRIGKEGNLWWKDGGWRANWEETMGHKKLGWLLPIGRPDPQLGLLYSPNPRFDSYGRWMRRRDWPAELRK